MCSLHRSRKQIINPTSPPIYSNQHVQVCRMEHDPRASYNNCLSASRSPEVTSFTILQSRHPGWPSSPSLLVGSLGRRGTEVAHLRYHDWHTDKKSAITTAFPFPPRNAEIFSLVPLDVDPLKPGFESGARLDVTSVAVSQNHRLGPHRMRHY